MQRNFSKIITIFLVMSLVIGSMNVFARENTTENISQEKLQQLEIAFKKIETIEKNSVEITDSKKITNVKNIAKQEINNQTIVLNVSQNNLKFDKAKVLEITEQNERYTAITVPVEGYSLLSNVTFLITGEQIINYTETFIRRGENNKFIVDTYYNGNLLESVDTDIEFITDENIQKGLDSLKQSAERAEKYARSRGVKETTMCIVSVLGLNVGVASLIASTCIASCPAVPPICATCITGVCAMGAADVSAITGCFGL